MREIAFELYSFRYKCFSNRGFLFSRDISNSRSDEFLRIFVLVRTTCSRRLLILALLRDFIFCLDFVGAFQSCLFRGSPYTLFCVYVFLRSDYWEFRYFLGVTANYYSLLRLLGLLRLDYSADLGLGTYELLIDSLARVL